MRHSRDERSSSAIAAGRADSAAPGKPENGPRRFTPPRGRERAHADPRDDRAQGDRRRRRLRLSRRAVSLALENRPRHHGHGLERLPYLLRTGDGHVVPMRTGWPMRTERGVSLKVATETRRCAIYTRNSTLGRPRARLQLPQGW